MKEDFSAAKTNSLFLVAAKIGVFKQLNKMGLITNAELAALIAKQNISSDIEN